MNDLPPIIGLGRYVPTRADFSWKTFDPSTVFSERDLPDYLIMGQLAKGSLKITTDGWSARWQGCEEDTHFSVTYDAGNKTFMINQNWCGSDGGDSYGLASIGLDKLILQTCYHRFPNSWDLKAKSDLENKFQLTYFEHDKDLYCFSGIPDGAFKTITFPLSIENLRSFHNYFLKIAAELNLPYPVSAYSRLLPEAINFVEGRAPEWTRNPAEIAFRSFAQTGLVPLQAAVRETAKDGTSAWTIRRMVYVVFIIVPMTGLSDLLELLCSKSGPVRYRTYPEIPGEMAPIVTSFGVDVQSESISYWDQNRSTRSTLIFQGADKQDKNLLTLASLHAAQDESTINSYLVAAEKYMKELQTEWEEAINNLHKKQEP